MLILWIVNNIFENSFDRKSMNQPLQLSKKEIEEFIKVHKKVSGELLGFDKAKEIATRLMELTVLIVTKVPKSDKKKVTTTNNELQT